MILMEPRPLVLRSTSHEILMVVVVSMCQFLNQCGIYQCTTLMNIVASSFSDVTDSDRSWFMALFPLSVGTLILISGRLGDLYGLKKVFLLGYLWLCLWSILGGLTIFTDSVQFLIVCRAFQGVGFALLFPCGLGILGLIYKQGLRKNIVFGVYAVQLPLGACIGALFSLIVGQLSWWPWAFWIFAIVLALLAVASYILVPNVTHEMIKELENTTEEYTEDRDSKVSALVEEREIEKMDWLGSFIGVTGLVLFNFVWNQAPVTGWDSPYIIVLLIVSVIVIGVFFHVERHYISNPLLHPSVFTKDVGLLLSSVFFGWGSFGIWTFYYWSFMMNVKGLTPILTAAYMFPLLIFGIVAALVASFTIGKYVRLQLLMFYATCGFFIGILMLSVAPVHQTYYKVIFASMFLLAFGMDMSFPALAISLSDYLPREAQGLAGSLTSTLVNYAMSLCLGVGTTLEQQILKKGGSQVQGYRAAMYVGVGLAGAGMMASAMSVMKSFIDERRAKREASN